MTNTAKTQTYQKKKIIILSSVFGLLFVLGITVYVACIWYMNTFNLEFKELLYTIVSPLKGTGQSTVSLIVGSIVPWVIVGVIVYAGAAAFICRNKPGFGLYRRIGAVLCVLIFASSLVFALFALRIPKYLEVISKRTTLYEDYYVDPDTVNITSDGETKNVIYLYLESMETTYASKDVGGAQPTVNYIPSLTEMTEDGITFTDKDEGVLGGFHTPSGTTWTMAALLSTTAGIPFSFPIQGDGQNYMSKHEYFAPGLITLGDILEDKGYTQVFLCGSNATFGGRRNYFTQHGNYTIYDLYTARDEGYIPSDYHDGWWGYEDFHLYDIAKDKLTELAKEDKPFNFTMLTVDTHHVNGNRCKLCGRRYSGNLGNVVLCADIQAAEFVKWCKSQDFYEDTVIIVSGDHPRMDTTLVENVDYYERTMYNCIFNSAIQPHGETSNRIYTSMDIFPTILAAMGFDIEGDRLGLGVNMFSGKETLAETIGYDTLNDEIAKHSDYYIREFS